MSCISLLGESAKLHAVLLFRGNPNMNSLIGLGAATSFTAGTASILLPGAGLEIGFLEEPVMLLAFVLLGRALETRARLKASGMSHFTSSITVVSSSTVVVTASVKVTAIWCRCKEAYMH